LKPLGETERLHGNLTNNLRAAKRKNIVQCSSQERSMSQRPKTSSFYAENVETQSRKYLTLFETKINLICQKLKDL
jgi:hypothetical protein